MRGVPKPLLEKPQPAQYRKLFGDEADWNWALLHVGVCAHAPWQPSHSYLGWWARPEPWRHGRTEEKTRSARRGDTVRLKEEDTVSEARAGYLDGGAHGDAGL